VSLDQVDWQQIKSEISNALREADVEVNGAENMDDLKMHLDKELSKAKTGIAKAKTALTAMKEFTDNLEKDKLINKKKGYKIELKGSDMYINGTKQPKEVTDKYRKYFKAKDYSIVSDGDSISSM
jgi:phenylalanyl-tRNA synthetase alpha subunit